MTERRVPGERSSSRASLTPIARGSLTDRVIEQLRERIADGTWPLRHQLPVEAALAKDLGVGRSTIREAVRVLVHAGLLEVRQGDGTYVRSRREIDLALQRRVSGAHLLEAYEVRRALEKEAAWLAALRRQPADVARLEELLEIRDAAHLTSARQYRKADAALYEQLVDAAGNPLLADLYKAFVIPLRAEVAQLFGDFELLLDDPDRPELSNLVQAIRNADPRAASEAAARHIDDVIGLLRLLFPCILVPR